MAVDEVSREPLSSPQSLFDAYLTGYSATPGRWWADAQAFCDGFPPFRPSNTRIPNRLKQADYRHVQPAVALSRVICMYLAASERGGHVAQFDEGLRDISMTY